MLRPRPHARIIILLAVVSAVSLPDFSRAQDVATETAPLIVGPDTEQRFPPLQLPPGFQSTLFACDPLVEYPSVISIGPRLGTLFVAHDYVTGLGVEIVRRDEIRLLQDTNEDGYADNSVLYAEGFNSIQGLAYTGGSVYVMHAPLLTVLRDNDGDHVADERLDLIKGLGLPPEENSNRLHCANGVVMGHDGWLYLALGDRGCDVIRPEGDRLLFQQGGILRCRADGSDLHVFSGGLRNIYDVALDDELHVFTRDNENDGGDYMIRVCHSFFGADHGYPYLYRERPEDAMPPLADLGRGSSAGVVCYLEDEFPAKYRGGLFCCEWGRAVVWYPLRPAGSGFAPTTESDFVTGAPDDPYGFKPTDLVVDYDGSLLISDWCDGQRPKRGRGRIYRVRYAGSSTEQAPAPSTRVDLTELTVAELIARLDSDSHHQRVAAQLELRKRGNEVLPQLRKQLRDGGLGVKPRLHLIWLLAQLDEQAALEELLHLVEHDGSAAVRAQAIRAIGDLADPALTRNRLEFARGDERLAARLAELARNADPRMLLEVVNVLARMRWRELPTWFQQNTPIDQLDATLHHAAAQAFRQIMDWDAVTELLDESVAAEATELRTLAVRAMSNQANAEIADHLLERLRNEPASPDNRDYVDMLARIYKLPAPWTYWGFRPDPRPPNSIPWERSDAIATALNEVLRKADAELRTFALNRMQREGIAAELASLHEWLAGEADPARVTAILEELAKHPAEDSRALLEGMVLDRDRTVANRISALRSWFAGLPDQERVVMLQVAAKLESGDVLAAALAELGAATDVKADEFLLANLDASEPIVRAAAIAALEQRQTPSAAQRIPAALSDDAISVRRAAARAAGILQAFDASDQLLELAAHEDLELRRFSILSLRQLGHPGAVAQAVAALGDYETQLAALQYLRDYGSVTQLESMMKLANSTRSAELLAAIAEALAHWHASEAQPPATLAKSIARLNGTSATILIWQAVDNASADADMDQAAKKIDARLAAAQDVPPGSLHVGSGKNAEISLAQSETATQKAAWLGAAIDVDAATDVEFIGSGDGTFQMWLNGGLVYTRQTPGTFRADSERFPAALRSGTNRVVIRLQHPAGNSRLHLRFRRKSSQAEREHLVQAALSKLGSPLRGRELYFNVQKSQCLKCHRIGREGNTIGPDLSGIGKRFSRIHLIESILEPSRSIAPSYGSMSVVLVDGQVVTGVRIRETSELLVLGDNQGAFHEIAKDAIEHRQAQETSIMPEGLEKQLSEQEFLDLIAFLLGQTE